MMTELSLKDKTNFLTTYLYPSIEAELIKALYTSANHPKQKYFLTAKGYELLSAQDKIIK